MTEGLLIFFSTILSTLFAYPVCTFCAQKGLKSKVTKRSSHQAETPTGGGITFVIPTTLFAINWFIFHGYTLEHAHFYLMLIVSAAALSVVGWVDDKKNISSTVRFVVQFLFIGCCVWFLPPIFEPVIGFWGDKILILFAWVWFINLFNFMDGLNTYATMQAVFLAIILSLFNMDFKLALLVLSGCLLGFSRVNKTPAKIFMGDVGSIYLGTLLGGLMLLQLSTDPSEWFFPLLTLPLLFTYDATFTLIKRTLKGKKPWQAHKEHWYQRANQAGFAHEQVMAKGLVLNFILMIIFFTQLFTHWDIALFLLALVVMMAATKYIKYIENKE